MQIPATSLFRLSYAFVTLALTPSVIADTTKSSTSTLPTWTPGRLPPPKDWKALNGTAWNVTYKGDLRFSGVLGEKKLGGDKCRTGVIGSKTIWNCGDMECNGTIPTCGFSYGPAWYGTDSVMTVNTENQTGINSNIFMRPWSGDEPPQKPYSAWGMDMSNVAPINSTHGVVYGWEIWRNGPNDSAENRGAAVASVTLGDSAPNATRVGPLLTGPGSLEPGLLAIMADGGYIYIYSLPNATGILTVSRVTASDDVFELDKYQTRTTTGEWVTGIPSKVDASMGGYNMNTTDGREFQCGHYGSVFYNAHLKKYLIFCNILSQFTQMYAADTPVGPWTGNYILLDGVYGYGAMAHPNYSPDNGKTIPWSQGPNGPFEVYTLELP